MGTFAPGTPQHIFQLWANLVNTATIVITTIIEILTFITIHMGITAIAANRENMVITKITGIIAILPINQMLFKRGLKPK